MGKGSVKIVDKYRPANPLRQDAWHKARLDLYGFMVQNESHLSTRTSQEAKELYGPASEKDHPYPSWSIKRGWYVKLIYDFIDYAEQEIEANKAMRQAA